MASETPVDSNYPQQSTSSAANQEAVDSAAALTEASETACTTANSQFPMSGGVYPTTSSTAAPSTSAGQLVMQQFAATAPPGGTAHSDEVTSDAGSQQHLAQGLISSQSMPFYIQGPGGVPMTFVTQDQALAHHQAQIAAVAQQQAAAAQQPHFPGMAPSPAHQNSMGSGESPAPPTPGSNSLGSPPPQQQSVVDGAVTPRSGTPATPGQQQQQGAGGPSPLELHMAQLQQHAQLQKQQQQQQQQQQQHIQGQDPALIAQQAHLQAQAAAKAESIKNMKPPKKPLTPYMRFSKSVWPRVKELNSHLSVCEIGASIGKMWRELADEEKGRYNDDFTQDKVRYDEEVQRYLKATGLQASDLVKPRSRKKKGAAAAVIEKQESQKLQMQQHQAQQQQQQQQQAQQSVASSASTAAAQQLPMHLFPGQQMTHNQAILFQNQLQGQLAAQSQGQGQAGFSPQAQQQQPVNGGTEQQTQQQQPQQQVGFVQSWAEAQQTQTENQQTTADSSSQMALNAYITMLHQAQLAQQQAALAQHAAAATETQGQSPQQQQQPSPGNTTHQPQASWTWHQQVEANASGQNDTNASRSEPSTPQHSTEPATTAANVSTESHAPDSHNALPPSSSKDSPLVVNGPPPSTSVATSASELPPNTAHNLFNSYAYNPWSTFPTGGQFGGESAGNTKVAAIDSKEAILTKELDHLKGVLAEKTKEVERLVNELDKAYTMIEQFKQQNLALNNSLALITTQAHMQVTQQQQQAQQQAQVQQQAQQQALVQQAAAAAAAAQQQAAMESIQGVGVATSRSNGGNGGNGNHGDGDGGGGSEVSSG